MLFKKAADANTWRVLEQLMNAKAFNEFYLCGGTSLALRFGHRLSVDIDLFTKQKFDKQQLKFHLQEEFAAFREEATKVSIFYFCYLNSVKTDFVYSKPEVISPFETIEGIRMWGLEDVVAMKYGQ